MSEQEEAVFKVSLNIRSMEESDFGFPNVVLGVTPESGADGSVSQLIRIDASGGFETTDRGALQVASLLSDAADTIRRELQESLLRELGREYKPTEAEMQEHEDAKARRASGVVEDADGRSRRPFNPKPIGGQ